MTTVIVVEDNDQVREVVLAMLEGAGLRVLAARDAAEAEQLCARETVSLLLTDVVLPGASGPELAEHLLGRSPGLRVLFMSGYTDEQLVDRMRLPAGSALIRKPFSLSELRASVAAVLSASLAV